MSFKISPDDSIQLSGPIYVGVDIPLDSRYLVANSGDLSSIPVKYAGMQVFAEDDKKLFLLQDISTDTWVEMPGSGSNGGTATALPNAGIFVSGSTGIATTYNTTMPDVVNSVPVGGLTAQPASYWKTRNLVQLFDDLLFPTVNASVLTNKSLSLGVGTPVGTLEVGTSHQRTLEATFSRGTIKNGDGSTNPNPLVGEATEYSFSGTNITNHASSSNTYDAGAVVVASGTNTWSVTTTYVSGSGDYFNNKLETGTNLNAQRVSGSIGPIAGSSVNGVYPWYVFKSSSPITAASMKAAIENPIPPAGLQKFVASSEGTLSVDYILTNQYLAVAHPASSTPKTKYAVVNSAFDNGGITVVFNLSTANGVTTSLWNNINYSVYATKAAKTETREKIELRN
jgi:hypothetical protein